MTRPTPLRLLDPLPGWGTCVLVGCLLSTTACQSGESPDPNPSADQTNTSASPSPSSTRTRRQAATLADGRADTFSLSVDLGTIDAFQKTSGSTRLETTGQVRLEPGYEVQSTVEVQSSDTDNSLTFSYIVFDQVDLTVDTHLQLDSSTTGMGDGLVDETVTLCQPESACSPTIEIGGATYDILPKARLNVSARASSPGSVRLGFEDDPARNYLKGGFDFETATGWHRRARHDFDVEPHKPEMSTSFDGHVGVQFEIWFELRLRNSNQEVASIRLLQASDSIEGRVQPPECYASRTLTVAGEVRRSSDNTDPYCLNASGSCLTSEPLYDRTVHETTHQFQDAHSGCTTSTSGSTDPDESLQRCTPGSDNCPLSNQTCMLGRCVTATPIRIALRWQAPTDLNLAVWDDDGNKLAPLGDADRGALDGWLAATSGGNHEDAPYFLEIAALRSADANKPVRFRVEHAGSSGGDPVPYTLIVHHRDKFENTRTFNGQLEATDASATYELRSDQYVSP